MSDDKPKVTLLVHDGLIRTVVVQGGNGDPGYLDSLKDLYDRVAAGDPPHLLALSDAYDVEIIGNEDLS